MAEFSRSSNCFALIFPAFFAHIMASYLLHLLYTLLIYLISIPPLPPDINFILPPINSFFPKRILLYSNNLSSALLKFLVFISFSLSYLLFNDKSVIILSFVFLFTDSLPPLFTPLIIPREKSVRLV